MYAFPLQVLITVVDRGKGDKMAGFMSGRELKRSSCAWGLARQSQRF